MEFYNDYIDIDSFDLTDYDFGDFYTKEDLPNGLFEVAEENEYVPEDGLLEYENISYQDDCFNKFLELLNKELQKEIPNLELIQKYSDFQDCVVNDEQLILDYYSKNENDIKFEPEDNKKLKRVVDYIINKNDIDVQALVEKARKLIDKKNYVTIKVDALNEIAKFEPKLETIDEFKNYKFDHVEKIEDEEIPVFVWIADAPGQQKLDLKYESIAQVSEALEEILKVLR